MLLALDRTLGSLDGGAGCIALDCMVWVQGLGFKGHIGGAS